MENLASVDSKQKKVVTKALAWLSSEPGEG